MEEIEINEGGHQTEYSQAEPLEIDEIRKFLLKNCFHSTGEKRRKKLEARAKGAKALSNNVAGLKCDTEWEPHEEGKKKSFHHCHLPPVLLFHSFHHPQSYLELLSSRETKF